MKSKIFIFFLVLLYQFYWAQDITFKSQHTDEPLSNVIIFDTSGKLLATSDINGKIYEKDLLPWREKYTLVLEGAEIALTKADLEKKIILLNDKITNISAVILTDNSKAKYVFIKGYFNQYNLTDKTLNQYLDGEITYVFDNKKNKLKKIILNQYRLFENPNSDNQRLKVLDLGELRKLSDENYRKQEKILQTEISEKSYLQNNFSLFTQKPFKLFGAEMKNVIGYGTYVYRKGNLDLNHFSEYHQKIQLEGKSKSMKDFLKYSSYSSFYVMEKYYGNEVNEESVDLEDSASHYKTEFWKEEDFPNMLPVLNKILNNNLKAVENKN